ncbi:hypothetical protein BD310DRAFT_916758 [Dichomitus squalens]|uniref:Uncharacterized protein n=1 Tax=Dichomitus squalens TaxID=114155 RepID=A0A4Q9Q817_9APHY|nr:hypothetical protein BD310DRAFT_916758 [Dichomitus squalens]
MTAGPSRSRVTRVELTADQLLGSDLTPARPFKHSKHGPKNITVEQLLGTSLTITPAARNNAASRSRSTPRPAARSPPSSFVRPSSSRNVPAVPNPTRITADEVLRTGLPVRTLQAAKQRARTGQTLVLTAEQLLGSGASGSSSSSPGSSRVLPASELAGSGPSSRMRSSHARDNASNPPSGPSRSAAGAGNSRVARPSTAGAATGGGSSGNDSSSAGRGRDNRPRQLRRSSSMGSTHTLPIYTKEPGESEVVISRGTADLEDEITITVMTPVEENGPSFVEGLPTSSLSASTVLDSAQQLSPTLDTGAPPALNPVVNSASSPVMTTSRLSPTPTTTPIAIPTGRGPYAARAPPAPYADEVPSYEFAMSTPDLHALPIHIPPPSSPALGSPRALSPSTPSPSTPASPSSRPDSSSPPSPTEGAESPRRRFGLRSLFRSSSRTRLRGGSVSGLPSLGLTSPPPPLPPLPVASPRPFHRSSHSASMLDLLSRSWSDNPMVRARSDRGDA